MIEKLDKKKLTELLDKKLTKENIDELSKEIIKKVNELNRKEKNKKRK